VFTRELSRGIPSKTDSILPHKPQVTIGEVG